MRLIPLCIGALAMALGFWTGLGRLGFELPARSLPSLAHFHGALMISGFLGTVISLERAVALGRLWSYAAPALASIGALLLLADRHEMASLAFLGAGTVFSIASAVIFVRHRALFTGALLIGALCWCIGTVLWAAGSAMPMVAGWWLNFLVLTIAAERLELSRLANPSLASRISFTLMLLLLLAGSMRGELADELAPCTGLGLVGCSAWLLRHDIARKTIHFAGQPAFAACSILAGHVWLGVAGLLLLIASAAVFPFDAAVHAITIGFVLSMIFGHAPIILPSVIGIRLPYTSWVYAPLALLHASVILRVGSDLAGWVDLRAWSGIVTVVALVGYVACLLLSPRKAAKPAI